MKIIKSFYLLTFLCFMQFVLADSETLALAATASYPGFTEQQYNDLHGSTDYLLTITISYEAGCKANSYAERWSYCTYLNTTSNLLADSAIAAQFNSNYTQSNIMRLNTSPSAYTVPSQLDYTVTGVLYVGNKLFKVSDNFTYALDPDGKTFWIAAAGATVTGQHMITASGDCIYAHDNHTINIVLSGDSDYKSCENQ